MNHHRERPTLGDKEISERIKLLDHGHLGKDTFEANIVSPVEPLGTYGDQQIDAGKPRVVHGGSRCVPQQINPGSIG